MNPIVFSLTVFLAGILSFFSPCVFPLLPVYIGILLGSDQEKAIRLFGKKIRWHGLLKTLCFIAGISVIFLLIGFGAGLLGQVIYSPWFRYLMGASSLSLVFIRWKSFTFISLRSKKQWILEPTNRRMNCSQLFSLVLALVLVGRLVLVRYWDQFLL